MRNIFILGGCLFLSSIAHASEPSNAVPAAPAHVTNQVIETDSIAKSIGDKLAEYTKTITYNYIKPLPDTNLHVVEHNGSYVVVNEDLTQYFMGNHFNMKDKRDLQTKWIKGALAPELEKLSKDNFISYPATGTKVDTLWVLSDISCGYCSAFHKKIPELNDRGIEVRVLPFVRGLHGGVQKRVYDNTLAIYSEPDNEKRRLMHDKAFAGQNVFDGMNADNAAHKYLEKGYQIAMKSGSGGTPTFINPNGRILEGLTSVDNLVEKFIPLD